MVSFETVHPISFQTFAYQHSVIVGQESPVSLDSSNRLTPRTSLFLAFGGSESGFWLTEFLYSYLLENFSTRGQPDGLRMCPGHLVSARGLVIGATWFPDKHPEAWVNWLPLSIAPTCWRIIKMISVAQHHGGGIYWPLGRNQKCHCGQRGKLDPVPGRNSCSSLVSYVHSRPVGKQISSAI